MESKLKATEEQRAYAVLLGYGMKAGLAMLVVTFAIYLTGVMPPHIPVNELQNYWGHPVKEYLHETGIHPGWWWVTQVAKGDFLNFVGVAFLAGVTILCYLRILPIFLAKKDKVYATIAFVEVLVLTLAASGLLKGGGH